MIRIVGFRGEMPRIHPRLLPEDAAQVATNTRLEDGTLVPSRDAALVHVFAEDTVSFVRREDGAWLGFPERAKAVPGPVNALRTYVTGGGDVPRVMGNIGAGQVWPLALHGPPEPILATILSGVVNTDVAEEVVYSFTYVTEFDEESKPAPLSNSLVVSPNCTVRLQFPAAPPAGRGINRIRIYRSQTDALGATNLFFLLDRSIAGMATDYDNDLLDPLLGEGCPSLAYDPPVDTLQGIVACANGIMAAFSGKDLYFSEPWRPHAWPTKYSLAVDSDIVGLASIGSSVAIMTKEVPYIAQGSTPDAMVLTRLEQNLPCVAAEGIVDMGYSVAYPSTEGIVVIDQNSGARMVSRSLFTREQWAALNPSTFVAGQHIGRYIVSYAGVGMSVREVLIFDLSGEQPFLIRSTERTGAFFFEIGSGNLFFRFGDRWVMEWDRLDQPKKPMVWRSRLYNLPTLTNFGAILVEADGYTGAVEGNEVRVYADGILRNTITAFNEVQRLSSGFLARKWEIEVRGTMTITAVSIAGTPEELTG